MSRVVVVTPSLSEPGGIASVVNSHLRSSLAEHFDLHVVETVRGSGPVRHVRGVWGVIKACAEVMRPSTCLVHVHMSVGASFWRKAAVLAVARGARKPTVLHLHGGRFPGWVSAGAAARARRVARVFARADVVVVLSETWVETVARVTGRANAVVVHNPVDAPALPSDGVGESHVVFLGRLDSRKGIGELLESIERLQCRGVQATWTLAGDGDVSAVRARVAKLPEPDAVSVPGWLQRDEVSTLLGSASVLCLPSYDEGLPMALLEAMGFGLACVTTPVGGIPDVIEDGINGLLTPPRDADELTRALHEVLSDPELARELGKRARLTVIERFSAQTVARELERVYASVGCCRKEGGG